MPDDPKPGEDERPDPKDYTISFRVPPDVQDKAEKRSKRERRKLSAILRAWLTLWAEDEAPSPPSLPGEEKRAAKRTRKK